MSDIKQKAREMFNEKFIDDDNIFDFIDQIIDLTISDYQTNFEQKHIASAVEEERKRVVNIINKADLINKLININK